MVFVLRGASEQHSNNIHKTRASQKASASVYSIGNERIKDIGVVAVACRVACRASYHYDVSAPRHFRARAISPSLNILGPGRDTCNAMETRVIFSRAIARVYSRAIKQALRAR